MTGLSDDMWWALLDAERAGTLLGTTFERGYIDVLEVVCPLNRLPLIVAWYERGDLLPEDAHRLLARWWSSCGYVHYGTGWGLSRTTLIDMFDYAGGFVTDDPGVSRPSHPLTIWRGGVPGAQRGLSWSSHFGEAEDFAIQRAWTSGCGELWRATVRPLYVLGIFNELEQDEVVVDPTGLGEIVTFARYVRSGRRIELVEVAHNER